ncbi:MAG: ComEC/Rec2 family competence protein [Clostridia bacterium]|nr:ComEC/Rec2 family competence protein [Clostridia bacterium]
MPILLCSAVILSGIFTYFAVTSKISAAAGLDGSRINGEVTVVDVEYTSENLSSYTVRFTKSDKSVTGKVSLTLEGRSAEDGDVYNGVFILSSPASVDRTEYYKNGIFLTAEAEEISYAGRDESFSLNSFFKEINEELCRTLKSGHGEGDLASAVLLGDRDGLGTAVKRDFSRLGIYHLLALSGLHLSVLVSALSGILERSRLKPLPRNAVKIAGILLYMALTGFSVSVVRAGVMHVTAILASSIDRDADSFTSLSAAAVFILLADPVSVFDAGLLLSVLAAYGCITMARLQNNRLRKNAPLFIKTLRYACDVFILTLFINLITLPVTWMLFGEVSLISPIVNILFIPAVTFLLVLSAVTLIFSGIPFISVLLTSLLYLTENVIIKTASALSYLRGITVSIRHAGTGVFIILLFLCLIPLAFTGVRTRKYLSASASLCILGIIITSAAGGIIWNKSCDVQYTVSGISDAMILRDGGRYTVIDVSSGTRSISYRITDAIKENKGNEIETLILTHYDTGHISSVPYMADRMIIRRVLLPQPKNDDEADVYERLAESLKEKHVRLTVYESDKTNEYSSGKLQIDLLSASTYEGSSHPLIALSFTLGGIDYTYGGRALSYADSSFIEKAESSDLLIIGAHPPEGDGLLFPYVTGKAVIPKKILTDELQKKLSPADIISVENNGIYTTGAYIPK